MDKKPTKSDLCQRIDGIVEHWLEQRRALLAEYGNLANIKTFSAEKTLHGTSLEEFCQSMIDYLSLIHFEIFEQLSQDNWFTNPEGHQQTHSLFDGIQFSTDTLLDFNDKYLAIDDLESLTEDLSSLGEEMAQRFELEDKLIAILRRSRLEKTPTVPR
ncbi:MAG: Rsd/AlgQ family anti-sigma factor [Porticoccaceae bacterium]|nr:Rsd/AlgQ family anti-sigma factor [Porticoccaceae bacterium]